MYTKEQVDAMLSQVEQEFEKTLGSINKNEEIEDNKEETVVESEEVMTKSEDEVETESEEEYETIDELYNSMSKSEKEAHYASCKKSLFGETEEAQETPAPQVEEVMNKSESEKLKEQNEELKKSYDQLNELVNKMFNAKKAPAQKAITSTSYIAKSEGFEDEEEVDFSKMSKGEITDKLKTVDQSNLTKSDREAINDFYLKNGSVDKIKHLIKE